MAEPIPHRRDERSAAHRNGPGDSRDDAVRDPAPRSSPRGDLVDADLVDGDFVDADPVDGAFGEMPDAVAGVVEISSMMTVFEADRLIRVAALHADALADVGRYGIAREVVERSVRLELAAAMRVSERTAEDLIAMADAVVHRYPAVWVSLSRANMTMRHARVLVAALDTIEPTLRDDVVPDGVALAEELPVGAFRRRLATLVDSVRHDTLAARHAAAVAGRRVAVERADDGMAWLMTYLPAVEAHAVFERATAMARVIHDQPREERTMDQIRADVIADLLIDGRVDAHPDSARGIRAEVVVTVPALALLGATDTAGPGDLGSDAGAEADAGTDAAGAGMAGGAGAGSASAGPVRGGMRIDPPTVEGVGPIPLETARRLCGGESSWMRVLTHPETGMVLSVGRDSYRPPRPLQRLVKWRAERCMAPGCGMPASRCQIDHQIAWADGGSTSLQNNAPLCQGHHTVKHHGNWTVQQIPDSGGTLEWLSPTGRRYLVQPERRVPTFRTDSPPAPHLHTVDAPF